MIKKLEPTGDLCVKFTEDELEQLKIKEGDKFSIEEFEDGILLKKYGTMEVDMSDFSRETLERLIKESCERDVSVNQIIEDVLKSSIENLK